MSLRSRKAFTLIELMVVIVAMALLAGIAIPNFISFVEKGYESEARKQLQIIHEANELHKQMRGNYWPTNSNSGNGYPISDINNKLGINLIESGVTYRCTGKPPGCYMCAATRSSAGYSIAVHAGPYDATNPKKIQSTTFCSDWCTTICAGW